jgi:hypothetical protein
MSRKFEDMGIGGLDKEFSSIFRRAFASRLFPPKIIAQWGIKHVKGMLLYGPPGTGKTLIARQIGKMLAQKEPKIVNGPEILNKFVGESESNIRKLFEDAEAEWSVARPLARALLLLYCLARRARRACRAAVRASLSCFLRCERFPAVAARGRRVALVVFYIPLLLAAWAS